MDVDEMKMIKDFGKSAPLPEQHQLMSARNRLVAAAVKERNGSAPAKRSWGRRLVFPAGITVGLAAAISGVFALTPVDGGAPEANAAVQVLHNAAEAALKLPDTPPRPDQFVYVKYENIYGTGEAWHSADGTRDGLSMQYGESPYTFPGCRDGKAAMHKGGEPMPGKFEDCTPDPHYDPNLPTNADEMLAYLKDPNNTRDPNDPYHMGEAVQNLISSSYLDPESRAALFEAASRIPGITVVEEAKDPSGRPGIGISFPSADGTPRLLIFDRDTYALIGTDFDAYLEIAIVDQAGQHP